MNFYNGFYQSGSPYCPCPRNIDLFTVPRERENFLGPIDWLPGNERPEAPLVFPEGSRLLVTVINNTEEVRNIEVFSESEGYGREELRTQLNPGGSQQVFAEPIQDQIGAIIWVSDPQPDSPNRSCRRLVPVGSQVSVRDILNNPDRCVD